MERRLDRSIENKEKITFPLFRSVIEDYRKVIAAAREMEVMITDASIVFSMTGK